MTQTSDLAAMQATMATLTEAVALLMESATAPSSPKPKASKSKPKPKAKAKPKGPSIAKVSGALAGLCKLSASMTEYGKMVDRYKDPEGILVNRKLNAEATLRRCRGVLRGHEAFGRTLWVNWDDGDWSGVAEACVAHAKQAFDSIPKGKGAKVKDKALARMSNAKVPALIALQSVVNH